MNTISVDELKELMDSGADFKLIDVREPGEYDAANIGGELVPLQTVPDNKEKFESEQQVVVMCRSGKRSSNAIQFLEQNFGIQDLYNLDGGILEWKAEIDPSLNVD